MYRFSSQAIFHKGYQHYFGAPVSEPATSTQENQSEAVPSHSSVNVQPPAVNPPKETPQTESKCVKSKSAVGEAEESTGKKECVDTSSFTVEQRVVAAAWVHERHHTHTSIGQIKQHFVERFGRPAPAKNTLLVWERKLFSTGSVHDAPRTGRPARRKLLVGEVAASLRAAPALSVRARAAALRVPHSTLRALLRRHLPAAAPKPKPKPAPAGALKRKGRAAPAAPRPGSPAAAPDVGPGRAGET